MHSFKYLRQQAYFFLFIICATLLFLPQFSRADDYYWYDQADPNIRFSSPQQQCRSVVLAYGDPSSTFWRLRDDPAIPDQRKFCDAYGTFLQTYKTWTFVRLPCPTGTTFNSQTGVCQAPQEPNGEVCGPKHPQTALPKILNSAGQCVDFEYADKPSQCKFAESRVRSVITYVQFDSNGVPSGPPTVDAQGCVAVPIGPNPYKNCKQPAPRKNCFNGICVELQSTTAKCNVAVQFTGAAGDGEFGFTGNSGDGEGPCDPDTDCTPETPPIETDRQPCNYHYDSPERQSCVSFDYKGVPGESSQCGQVNGVMQCIAKRPASSNGTQIDTTVETKSNPDGTTTTTKTDIRTDVICSGPNACQSVTTKTTNVTIKDSNGNATSSETKCEGAKCGKGIGKGDGSGTGQGDCIVNCDEEDSQVTAPELGEVASYAESIQAFQAAIEGSPIMSAVSSIALTGSGSCNMGSTNTAIGTISLDYICTNSNWLDDLYFVFLAIWGLAAVRVLLSA